MSHTHTSSVLCSLVNNLKDTHPFSTSEHIWNMKEKKYSNFTQSEFYFSAACGHASCSELPLACPSTKKHVHLLTVFVLWRKQSCVQFFFYSYFFHDHSVPTRTAWRPALFAGGFFPLPAFNWKDCHHDAGMSAYNMLLYNSDLKGVSGSRQSKEKKSRMTWFKFLSIDRRWMND